MFTNSIPHSFFVHEKKQMQKKFQLHLKFDIRNETSFRGLRFANILLFPFM